MVLAYKTFTVIVDDVARNVDAGDCVIIFNFGIIIAPDLKKKVGHSDLIQHEIVHIFGPEPTATIMLSQIPK